MKIVFAGHKTRGVRCLQALVRAGHQVVAVLVHANEGEGRASESVSAAAQALGLPVLAPAEPHAPEVLATLHAFAPDLVALAGYSPILREPLLRVGRYGAVNLHGGKLPQYRGSSPMNWALINGEQEFTVCVIQVDRGVDTGDVLLERTFPVGPDDTIVDLHRQANAAFPELLVEAVHRLEQGKARPRKQDEREAAYYPLRFPEDGLVLWDVLTAQQVHNRVRALTEPYPGAFAWWNGLKIKLLRSRMAARVWHGEPGRVYQKSTKGALICAQDKCLWIEQAVVEDTQEDALAMIPRYDKFATLRDLALAGGLERALR